MADTRAMKTLTGTFTINLVQYMEIVNAILKGVANDPDRKGDVWDATVEANRILSHLGLALVHTGEEDYVPLEYDS
jgi:hypothetical protein